jgi:hypothetical protein
VKQLSESQLNEAVPDEEYRLILPTVRHAITEVLVAHPGIPETPQEADDQLGVDRNYVVVVGSCSNLWVGGIGTELLGEPLDFIWPILM